MLKQIKMDPKLIQANSAWRSEALRWWRKYIINAKIIKELRAQNRCLRLLLSDYSAESEKK